MKITSKTLLAGVVGLLVSPPGTADELLTAHVLHRTLKIKDVNGVVVRSYARNTLLVTDMDNGPIYLTWPRQQSADQKGFSNFYYESEDCSGPNLITTSTDVPDLSLVVGLTPNEDYTIGYFQKDAGQKVTVHSKGTSASCSPYPLCTHLPSCLMFYQNPLTVSHPIAVDIAPFKVDLPLHAQIGP